MFKFFFRLNTRKTFARLVAHSCEDVVAKFWRMYNATPVTMSAEAIHRMVMLITPHNPHDCRANKRHYREDGRKDSQCYRYWLSIKSITGPDPAKIYGKYRRFRAGSTEFIGKLRSFGT